jgi:anti-anti-sigma factor
MIESGKLSITEQMVPGPAGDVLVAKLQGKLLLGKESVLLRDHLLRRLDAGSSQILLVLEKVAFMDSTGVAVLVELKAHAIHRGGDVRLCRCPSSVARILHRLALHRILEVFETEDAALLSWASASASGSPSGT